MNALRPDIFDTLRAARDVISDAGVHRPDAQIVGTPANVLVRLDNLIEEFRQPLVPYGAEGFMERFFTETLLADEPEMPARPSGAAIRISKAYLERAFASGQSVRDVAKELDCSATKIRKHCATLGVDYPIEKRGARAKLPDIVDIIVMIRLGVDVHEIAERCGTTASGVRQRLMYYGFVPNGSRSVAVDIARAYGAAAMKKARVDQITAAVDRAMTTLDHDDRSLPSDAEIVVAIRHDSKSPVEIAKASGVSILAVYRAMDQAGYVIRGRHVIPDAGVRGSGDGLRRLLVIDEIERKVDDILAARKAVAP